MTDPTPPHRRKDDEWKEYLEGRLRGFFMKMLFAFAIIGITSAVAIFGFGAVLKKQNQQGDEIQMQRFQSLVTNCRDQNRRHEKTVAKAADLPAAAQRTVIVLVDELLPYNDDCLAYARSRVKETD